MKSGAEFSACGAYRYTLWRQWDPMLSTCLFIMLNPSTADADKDDPTVAKCGRYARAWGYGRLEVRNIFALRSTNPNALYSAADPVGPGNNDAILSAARTAELVVCAWGVHGELHRRGREVLSLLAEERVVPHALAITQCGEPGHPLYLPGKAKPVRLWLPTLDTDEED